MAGRSKDVLLRFLVDDKQKSKLAGIGTAAGTAQSKFQNLSGSAKAVVGGIGAIIGTKIVSFLGDAAQAAAEDQKAQELLALAIDNSTTATDLQIESVEPWIKKMSLASGVADDELRPALAELVRTTGDLGKAQEIMGIAMDIAAAKGVPLETVTKAIGKAALGNIGALGRLGVATRDANGDTMTFEDTLDEAARTMGGAAATAADTMAGRMAIFKVKIDEAKESLGNVLIPSLADAADAGGDLVTVLGYITENLEKIGGAESEDGSIWSTIIKFTGFEAVIDGLGWVADKIGDVGAAATKTENPFQGVITNMEDVAGSTDEATEALEDFEAEIRSQIDPIFNLIQKVNDLDAAQTATADSLIEYGRGSPQHRETLRKEAEAWLSVKDAQIKAANEAGLTRDAFRKVLQDMRIFTSAEIDLILEDFDRVDDYQFRDKIVNVRVKGGTLIGDDISGRRAHGGPVTRGRSYLVGERGPEVVTMGGNGQVTPNGQLGGSSYEINVNAGMGADGARIGQQVVEAIRQYEKRNGRGWRS